MELNNDHNVYILGAGFSRDAGLPLIGDFLLQMRDSHEWLLSQDRKAEAEAINRVLEFRLDAASAAYWVTLDLENIEELFSLASASSGAMDQQVKLAIAATLDFARTTKRLQPYNVTIQGPSKVFVDVGPNRPAQCPPWAQREKISMPGVSRSNLAGPYKIGLYAYYIARLLGMFLDGKPRGHNTFITFNYDTLVEEALRELRLAFCYGFKPSTVNFDVGAAQGDDAEVHLLKLHGSANWARPKQKGDRLTVYNDYGEIRCQELVPELVPPTWKKVFENQIEAVWEKAVQQLSAATRIVVIGFSMPPTDMHFKYLIAAGLQKNISLRQILFVKPDANELKGRAATLLRKAYIDSDKIDFADQPLSHFMSEAGSIQRIGRPLEAGIRVTIQEKGDGPVGDSHSGQ